MNWIIEFDVSALFITGILLWVTLRRKDLPIMKNISYQIILVLCILSSLFDIISVYTLAYADKLPVWVNYAILLLYTLPFCSIPVMYYIYVMSLTIQNRIISKARVALVVVPYAIQFLLVVPSPFTHWYFYLDESLQYCRNWGVYVTYGISLLYLILCYYDVIHYRKHLTPLQIGVVFLTSLSSIASVMLQLVYGKVLLINFAAAVSALITCFTLQSPIGAYDTTTGSFSLRSFRSMLMSLFRRKKSFTVFCMEPLRSATYYEALGSNVGELSVAIAACFRELAPRKPIYHLNGLRFALITKASVSELKPLIDEIFERCQQPFRIAGRAITLTPVLCTIPVPDSAGYLDDVIQAIQGSMEEAQSLDAPLRIVYAGETSLVQRRRKSAIAHVLKRVLQNEELRLYYQPIYSAREHRFVAAEALLRLHEKSLGDISPAEFLPIAEKLGIMPQISRLVIEQACAFISANRLWEKGIRCICINLTSADCLKELLPDEVTQIMDRYHVPCNMLQFEVTGDAVSKDTHHFPEVIRHMSALGTDFSLDAFTSAFSNDGVLFAAPFRKVKISREFLKASASSETKRTLLKHVISLCRELSLEVVAVGVETKELSDVAASCGCHYYQGFYYSHPLTEKDLLAMFL